MAELGFYPGPTEVSFHCQRLRFYWQKHFVVVFHPWRDRGVFHLKTRIDYHEAHFNGRIYQRSCLPSDKSNQTQLITAL